MKRSVHLVVLAPEGVSGTERYMDEIEIAERTRFIENHDQECQVGCIITMFIRHGELEHIVCNDECPIEEEQ